MRHTPHIFFSDDVFDAFPEQEDDIDKLFRNLEQVEPPPTVIERILSSVSQLPPPVLPVSPGAVPPTVPVPHVSSEAIDVLNEAPSEAVDVDSDRLQGGPWDLLDGLVVRKEQCEPS